MGFGLLTARGKIIVKQVYFNGSLAKRGLTSLVKQVPSHICFQHINQHTHDADPHTWSPPLTHPPLDKIAAIMADNIFKCIFLNQKIEFC